MIGLFHWMTFVIFLIDFLSVESYQGLGSESRDCHRGRRVACTWWWNNKCRLIGPQRPQPLTLPRWSSAIFSVIVIISGGDAERPEVAVLLMGFSLRPECDWSSSKGLQVIRNSCNLSWRGKESEQGQSSFPRHPSRFFSFFFSRCCCKSGLFFSSFLVPLVCVSKSLCVGRECLRPLRLAQVICSNVHMQWRSGMR